MAINSTELVQTVQNFVAKTADVQGAAVVTLDGLPIASSLPNELDEDRVLAMSAAIVSLSNRIAKELIAGQTDRIYVEGNEGVTLMTNCGNDAVFLVLAGKEAKQKLEMLEIKDIVDDVKRTL